MTKNESILDQPREDLDANVWNNVDGNYVLTDQAKSKIYVIVKWVVDRLGVSDYGVNIIGSITSNSYTDDSDIDLHFNSKEIPEEKSEQVNKILRQEFDKFKMENEDVVNIGSHPIEVYFQSNPYQDMMSVGCYDVINDRWLVGPDLKNKDFDPYSEYYGDDMEYVKDVIGDIRNIILECYESAIAIQNARKQEFKDFEMQHLRNGIERAAAIFTNARQFRKVSSSPTDEKTAKTNRDSRKWKIADSAFKLLDKFGYLAILRTMTQCFEKAQTGEITNDEIVSQVVNSIRDNLANNANLDEEQKNMFCEMCGQVEEGLGKTLGMFALMAAMFGLPGEASAKEIEKHGKNIPQQVVDGVKDVDVNKDFGGLSYVKLVNLVATVIYNEAMIDYQKTKNDNCLIAIANVIQNRAGKDPKNFIREIKKGGAFYSTREVRGGYSNSDYREYFPGLDAEENEVPYNKECWKKCVAYAVETINGRIKNVIGNRNMIANKGKDNKKDWDAWGKDADLRIGSHTFGYQRSEDGYIKYGNAKPQTYTIKSGDTLGGIARKFNTTEKEILRKNPNIKDPNRIRIGQKISV